ncbi:MAG: J domain-containing protein, partial [Pyrinomonadaceae bacterium]
GALRLARERVRAVVYFDAGAAVYARSNLRAHRFAESLVRWGVITDEQFAGLSAEGTSDEEVAAMLVATRALTGDQLVELRSRQCADVLRPLLLWTDGEWDLDLRARPAEEVRVALDVNSLLIEAARRLPTEFVSERLGDDDEIVAPVTPPPEGPQLTPAEAFVLSRVDAALRVGEIVTVSGLPEAAARQAVYALALAGVIRREGAGVPRVFTAEALARSKGRAASAGAPGQPAAKPASRAEAKKKNAGADAPEADTQSELAALFSLAGAATHYDVLSVGRNVEGAELKRSYYALAKRFHPDRFSRDADAPLKARVEDAFAKITRAYDVLKDPKLRAAYDLRLKNAPQATA